MTTNNIFNSSFKNINITQIVAFDSKYDFNLDLEELKEKIKETRYFSESFIDYRPLSENIYDSEYANTNSEKVLVIETKIKLAVILFYSEEILNREIKKNPEKEEVFRDIFDSCKKIKEFYIDPIQIILSFDSCGVHSIRADFNLNPIKTPELINMVKATCSLIDDFFFNCLKEDLQKNKIIEKDMLIEPMTYSVISCTDADINPFLIKKEILGISWKTTDYEEIDKRIFKDITNNDIAIYEGDILTVTTQATFMVFFDVADKYYDVYVNERINAIEIFWRQKFLLKKMHFQLDTLIKDVDILRKSNIESAIKSIEFIQIAIQSELEAYRNTIISVTHSYSMLFETLNKVLKINKHYDFVQEKLETCKSIYDGLNEDRRNNLMENIQWIVVVIGIATVLLPLLTDVIYGPDLGPKQTWNVIFIIGFVLFGGLGIIFKTNIKSFIVSAGKKIKSSIVNNLNLKIN
ncbi:hypothetical protein [Methanobacterium sp.]|uniref:hypothetical protein n=1 Tax=Methanobacterium sp. TaxID=2164 RepID=UPI003C70BCFE